MSKLDNLNNLIKNIYPVLPISISLLFGVLIILIVNDDINRDGVGYIIQANLLKLNATDTLNSSNLYSDPFFSNLILKIHNLSGFSLRNSSLFFNFCCLFISSFSFFGILRFISKKNLILWLGLIVFIASVPFFDKYLTMTLRDHGMWAALLTASYNLLLFSASSKNIYFLLSVTSIIIATLFRAESIVFLIAPILIFTYLFILKIKHQQAFKLIVIALGCLAFLFGLIITTSFWSTRFLELFDRLIIMINGLATELPLKSNHLWLSGHLVDYPIGIKFSLLSYIFFKKWIFGLGLPCIIFAIIGFQSKIITKETKLILVSMILISVALVCINFLSTLSLTPRYFMFQYLLIYIFAAIGLYEFINKNTLYSRYKQLMGKILIGCLIIQIIGNIYDKPSDNVEKNAAVWIMNNNIDIDDLYLPDLRIRYYLNQLNIEEKSFEDAVTMNLVNYIILNKADFSLGANLNEFDPVEWIPSQNKAKIIIYKRKS